MEGTMWFRERSHQKVQMRGSEMKKTLVYWVGLIIVGFTVWGTFIFLWTELITSNYRMWRQYGWLMSVVGIIIFLYIGLRMMNEDKKNKDLEDQRRE